MYRKFDVTENLLFAQYFFLRSKHSLGQELKVDPKKMTCPADYKQHARMIYGWHLADADITVLLPLD
jgi:hypothetical protein